MRLLRRIVRDILTGDWEDLPTREELRGNTPWGPFKRRDVPLVGSTDESLKRPLPPISREKPKD